jgi:hypothetical protein
MIDVSCNTDDRVMGRVIIVHEFLDLFLLDVGQHFSDSQSGLAQEVVTVGSVVDGF